MKLLLTRPAVESEKLARLAQARGFEPVINPLLEVVPLITPQPVWPYTHIVFTSAAAPRLMPESVDRSVPVHCVGEATAAASRQAGFAHIISQAPSVEALLPELRRLQPGAQLLYPVAATARTIWRRCWLAVGSQSCPGRFTKRASSRWRRRRFVSCHLARFDGYCFFPSARQKPW